MAATAVGLRGCVPGQKRSVNQDSFESAASDPAWMLSSTLMSSKSSSDWNDRRRPRLDRRAADQPSMRSSSSAHRAAGRAHEAGHRVDDRGLARTVRADQADDLAGAHLEAHAIDGDHRAEAHGEVLHLQGQGRHRFRVDRLERHALDRLRDEVEPLEQAPLARRHVVRHDVGDAVLVEDEDGEQDHATDELVPVALAEVDPVLDDPRSQAADGVRGGHDHAEDEAEAADDGVADRVDRLERAVAPVGDHVGGEADEDAGDRGDRRRHTERVELHAEDADAERRRGALVGAHRDQATTGPRPPQVRHDQPDEHERDQADDRPPMRVRHRVDVDAEELDRADLGAAVERITDPVGVGEDRPGRW